MAVHRRRGKRDMLRSVNSLIGYTILATDGEIGSRIPADEVTELSREET